MFLETYLCRKLFFVIFFSKYFEKKKALRKCIVCSEESNCKDTMLENNIAPFYYF